MDGQREDSNGLRLGKFDKRRPTFFQIYGRLVYNVSKCHLHSWKIILSCYVAMILQMKDSYSTNLTFSAHKIT